MCSALSVTYIHTGSKSIEILAFNPLRKLRKSYIHNTVPLHTTCFGTVYSVDGSTFFSFLSQHM